jgi:hypothetical protein
MPGCAGVMCPRHHACQNYHAISENGVQMGTCVKPDGTRPSFVPVQTADVPGSTGAGAGASATSASID